jgi:hypothetical protein
VRVVSIVGVSVVSIGRMRVLTWRRLASHRAILVGVLSEHA